MNDIDITDSQATRSAAFNAAMRTLPLRGTQLDIVRVMRQAHAAGVIDLSGRELQQLFEQAYGRRIDASTIAARVNSMVAAGVLQRCAVRMCTVTGVKISPFRAVPEQIRMVA